MTTSDDEPRYEQDGDLAATTHAEPLAAEGLGDGLGDEGAPVAAGGGRRVALGILAGVLVALAGVVIWAFIFAQAEREYVGVAVVVGLAVGWVIRVVSGRSDLWLRIVAVLLTALTCVAGTVAGEVAYTAKAYRADFWSLLGDIAPDWLELLDRRPPLTFAIFLAGLVLAYLSASPQKEKPAKASATATPAYAADEELPDPLASDGARDYDTGDDDEERPPSQLPPG